MASVLRSAILQQEVVWILVQPDGSARLAVPTQVPPSELGGEPRLSLQAAIQHAAAFQARMSRQGRRWLVVVSDPFERPQPLPMGDAARPLDSGERTALADLQMEIPLGEWASAARLQVLDSYPGPPKEAAS